ncbi:hypothetical protein JCM17846_03350 [Iodidimonas nitroreducens]|uniref:Uncharacterized protein n=1 Tax=Iodidimonas nitroreducens TaxID=1236968 RepID=A0A5A7N314_9PROT|nr:hypothetical protein JCM17846_03350 [Iodidimonas nitroreducens]
MGAARIGAFWAGAGKRAGKNKALKPASRAKRDMAFLPKLSFLDA